MYKHKSTYASLQLVTLGPGGREEAVARAGLGLAWFKLRSNLTGNTSQFGVSAFASKSQWDFSPQDY